MTVDPFHRLCRRERKRAGQHFVKRHAKCIEIATRIDRPIHSTSLLGCHICQGSRDNFWRTRRLALTQMSRCHAEPRQTDDPGHRIDKYVRGLDIFMNESSIVNASYGASDSDGEEQEISDLHRPVGRPTQRLTASILKHENST